MPADAGAGLGRGSAFSLRLSLNSSDWYIAIDATSIALRHGLVVAGWPVVNLIMAAVGGLVLLESIIKAVPVPKKYVETNIKAVVEAYESMKKLQSASRPFA
jgi:pyruvate ferredoxin oxidoreductase gamma subunit